MTWLVEELVAGWVIARFFARIDREGILAFWEAEDA